MTDLNLLFWEATRFCNLECPHCRAQATNRRSSKELTTKEAEALIDSVVSFSRPIFVFSGGEPLARNDIYELIKYADISGLKTALASNATLITYEVARALEENGLKLVSVSVYGSTEESHDAFCGREGAFNQTLKGIENLKKAGIDFQINTTVTKMNIEELQAIGAFALKQGAVGYHPFFLVPTGNAKFIKGDELMPQEYEKAFDQIYNFSLHFPLNIKVTCAPHYYRVLKTKGGAVNSKGCLAGVGVSFVSYKGEVFGCGYLPVAAGDLRKQAFKDIWFESGLFKILRDESSLEGKCGICGFKYICGGCRARAFEASGDYLAEEPCCAYQP